MCIGVPPAALPVGANLEIENSRLHRWIADRRWREGQQQTLASTPSPSMIVVDDESDIAAYNGSSAISNENHTSGTVSDDDNIESSMDIEETCPVSPTARQNIKRVRRTYYGSGNGSEQPSIISSSKTGQSQTSQRGSNLGNASANRKRHVVHVANRAS